MPVIEQAKGILIAPDPPGQVRVARLPRSGVSFDEGTSMISVGVLWPDDRPTWETLFAGYNDFYGRTLPQESFDRAWREFQEADRMHARGWTAAWSGSRTSSCTPALPQLMSVISRICSLRPRLAARGWPGR
jgi:hypothetical protein